MKTTIFIIFVLAVYGGLHVAGAVSAHFARQRTAEIIENQNRLTEAIEDLRCRMDEIKKGSTYLFVTPCKYHKP